MSRNTLNYQGFLNVTFCTNVPLPPGWSLKVDLVETCLEDVPFAEHSYGMYDQASMSGNDWLVCKKEGFKFVAYGGPEKLQEMIKVFLDWANSNTKTTVDIVQANQ